MAKINEVFAEKIVRHPIRVEILALLATNEKMSPNEMAKAIGKDLGVVAYHVRTMEDLGALKPVGTKQRRGATEHFYSMREPAKKELLKAAQEVAGRANIVIAVFTL